MPLARIVRPALAVAAVPLGVVAYRVQVHDLHSPPSRAAATVAVAWSFALAGLVAWSRRPENRLGPLMTAAGFALLARQLRYSHDALAFTVFFLLGDLGYVLVGHSTLAYPAGRVGDRLERALVRAGYVVAVAFPLAILLFHGRHEALPYIDAAPRSLLLVSAQPGLVRVLQKAFAIVLYGGLALALLALIARRLARATPRERGMLAPLLLAGAAIGLRAVFESVFTFVSRPVAYDYLFWWQFVAFVALPIALLAGLLRARLARATVGDLVLELERTPPEGIRDALARALRDPSIELAFWLPAHEAYVDSSGRPVELSTADPSRAVTLIDGDEGPLAALEHDRSLLEEPRLVDAATAAARLALSNARLRADLQAQLAEVDETQRRVDQAAGDERRRIERDLHDGAQQRLVSLALQLRIAQRRFGTAADPEVDRILETSVGQLQAAVVELRELAHGDRPATLTEDGLAAALESLAARSPLEVTIDVGAARLPAAVETAAYFVACEALANALKHARASSVSVIATAADGVFAIEVRDDGVGGARAEGSGLRGLADRLAALGGRLRVESPVGGGTRVIGEIPCAS
jgi:signal transduction histidine kinase